MLSLEDFVPDGDFQQYLYEMGRDGVYADHNVVVALAVMLSRDMLIVTSSPQSDTDNCIVWIEGVRGFSGSPLLLGRYWENHYQSLQPIDARDDGNYSETCL